MIKKEFIRTGMVGILVVLSFILESNCVVTPHISDSDSEFISETKVSRIYQRVLSSEIPEKNKINMEGSSNPRAFSTYLGGTSKDYSNRIATDSEDNIIVVGSTISDDFLALNASDPTFNGQFDTFIAKFSPTGTLKWSTYLGGLHQDLCYGLAVDSQDNIIISGDTNSSDFPTVNSYDDTKDNHNDVFVAKLSPLGALIWSTYFGGRSDDYSSDIAVDSYDNIIITGYTNSSDFPTLNATNPTFRGKNDTFIAKFSSAGVLEWSTFLGGYDEDFIEGVTIDSNNEIIVTGSTKSEDFPTVKAHNTTYNKNSWDIFVTKLTDTGKLEWSTFFGGVSDDFSRSITTDSQNNIVITGDTNSSDFPTLKAFSDTYIKPFLDSFVTKFSPAGALEWSTYLGGVSNDNGNGVACDSQDNILITGSTWSYDFPAVNAYDDFYNRAGDAFVTKFSSSGQYEWGMFLGGTSKDIGKSIIVDLHDYFMVTGTTTSGNFPIKNSFDDTYNKETDGFIYHMLDPLLDRDFDDIPDYWELEMGLNPTNPNDAEQDFDTDGLTNLQEFLYGLDPKNPDCDSDGALDGEEISQVLLDPKNAFFNPINRIIILSFITVVPGIAFIYLSFQWREKKKTRTN